MTTPEREKFDQWAADQGIDSPDKRAYWEGWQAALSAAPAPPGVEPDCWAHLGSIASPYDKETMVVFKRDSYFNVPLYTSPPSPKAEYDAEGNLMAAAKDASEFLQSHRSGHKVTVNLRKFIGTAIALRNRELREERDKLLILLRATAKYTNGMPVNLTRELAAVFAKYPEVGS